MPQNYEFLAKFRRKANKTILFCIDRVKFSTRHAHPYLDAPMAIDMVCTATLLAMKIKLAVHPVTDALENDLNR